MGKNKTPTKVNNEPQARIALRLSKSLHDELVAKAKAEELNKSDIVRIALKEYLAKEKISKGA